MRLYSKTSQEKSYERMNTLGPMRKLNDAYHSGFVGLGTTCLSGPSFGHRHRAISTMYTVSLHNQEYAAGSEEVKQFGEMSGAVFDTAPYAATMDNVEAIIVVSETVIDVAAFKTAVGRNIPERRMVNIGNRHQTPSTRSLGRVGGDEVNPNNLDPWELARHILGVQKRAPGQHAKQGA